MTTVIENIVYDISKSALINKFGKVLKIVDKPKQIVFDFSSGSFRTVDGILVIGVQNIAIKQ